MEGSKRSTIPKSKVPSPTSYFLPIQWSKNFFIADFYCHEIKMAIELDGHIHIKRRDYDKIRTEILDLKIL
jgi:very-short-patch-repair endonuclease